MIVFDVNRRELLAQAGVPLGIGTDYDFRVRACASEIAVCVGNLAEPVLARAFEPFTGHRLVIENSERKLPTDQDHVLEIDYLELAALEE